MPRAGSASVPLSHAQERLWFLDRLLPAPGLYNLFQAMRITGPLDVGALGRSLNEIVKRHDVFRTAMVDRGDGPVQEVVHPAVLPLAHVDLTDLPFEHRDREILNHLGAEAKRPFDLSSDQLLRALLIHLGPNEHVLLLTMHHIVSDGWTLGILFQEIATLHDAFAAGRSSPLPTLPIRFADYAVWERETFRGETLERALAYWRDQLAGAALLDLPTDHPRTGEPSARGATESHSLPANLVSELRAFSHREGTTLFMTLLAGFQALLHRYSGQDDIVVGSCVAGRPQIELENLAGFFVNTLVLRTSAGGQPGFRDLLARTRETVLGAMAHQDLPFEKLVAELRPDRGPARNPFFEVMFVLQSAAGPQPRDPVLQFEPIELDNGTAKFDLTLSLVESSGGLVLSAEYRRDLFEPGTIRRLLDHYHRLLAAAVAEPGRPIAELPFLADEERHRLLTQWSGRAVPYPRDATVVDLFREQAMRRPNAVALCGAEDSITYRELDDSSTQLAHLLRQRGVAPGTLVAFCLERSPAIPLSLLAILKAGAGYVSLDPAYPTARLHLMISDARPVVLITQVHLQPLVESVLALDDFATRPVLLVLESDHEEIARQPLTPLEATISAESVAYVSYTSGSTGRPKGVCIPHRGIVRLVRNADYFDYAGGGTFLQFAPVAFDASVIEIWGALLNGARLAIHPPGMPSLAELANFIRQQQVTALFLTTGLFHQMIDEQAEQLEGVQQFMTGGDVLSPAHAARALARFPHARIVNAYGPTENSTITTAHQIMLPLAPRRSIPIGRPIANTTVYILDAHLQPVPVGVAGELYTGGDGLATGYLRRPDLDAERFVSHPFEPAAGARLYRTGDLARWLPDGTIEFLGRVDRQVKLRGFRIEPGEIEAVLAVHPDIAQAAVVLDRNPASPRLVAYVSSRAARKVIPNEVKGWLQKTLPEHMVPAVIVPVDAIPLNANGKVDITVLPAPDSVPANPRPSRVAPRNAIEARLAAIWETSLGVTSIGVHDNFFDLGGHSMSGVRLFAHIEREFGVRLPLSALFEYTTIEQLATQLREPIADPAPPVPATPVPSPTEPEPPTASRRTSPWWHPAFAFRLLTRVLTDHRVR